MASYWFNYLKTTETQKGLFPRYETNFVICEEYLFNRKVCHRFASFTSSLELAGFLRDADGIPNFYEVIRGTVPLKPFFDIDMKTSELGVIEPESVVEDLIRSIMDLMPDVELSEIQVCESVDPSKEKFSYHLVINRSVESMKHAKILASDIIERMNPDKSRFVDTAVYSTNRQFRLMGCAKLRLDSKPRRIKEWSDLSGVQPHKNQVAKILQTMVSHVAFLKNIHVDIPEKIRTTNFGDLSNEQVSIMELHIPAYASDDFTIDEARMDLKRICPSMCPICKRVHEHEHMFMTMSESGEILYWCRRDLSRPHKLFQPVSKVKMEDLEQMDVSRPKKKPSEILPDSTKEMDLFLKMRPRKRPF